MVCKEKHKVVCKEKHKTLLAQVGNYVAKCKEGNTNFSTNRYLS